MKKFIPVLLGVMSVFVIDAQDRIALKKHYLKVYNQALNYNDVNTAINALHDYLAEDNNILYKDTLSMLYFNVKSYYSSLLLSEEVYKKVPDNVNAMARAAECYDELGDPKTAVSLFERVVPKTRSPYHYYRLALCQYQLKRTAECEASAKFAMADTNSKKISVKFSMANGSQQSVPVDAAAANILGVLKMDTKNFADAKAYFQHALTLFPQFAGAKDNLDACERNMKGPKTPPKTQSKSKG